MPGIETQPRWTEWRYRVRDPNQFSEFARKTISTGVTAILGINVRGGKKVSTIQAYRFSKSRFKTKAQIKTWLKENKA